MPPPPHSQQNGGPMNNFQGVSQHQHQPPPTSAPAMPLSQPPTMLTKPPMFPTNSMPTPATTTAMQPPPMMPPPMQPHTQQPPHQTTAVPPTTTTMTTTTTPPLQPPSLSQPPFTTGGFHGPGNTSTIAPPPPTSTMNSDHSPATSYSSTAPTSTATRPPPPLAQPPLAQAPMSSTPPPPLPPQPANGFQTAPNHLSQPAPSRSYSASSQQPSSAGYLADTLQRPSPSFPSQPPTQPSQAQQQAPGRLSRMSSTSSFVHAPPQHQRLGSTSSSQAPSAVMSRRASVTSLGYNGSSAQQQQQQQQQPQPVNLLGQRSVLPGAPVKPPRPHMSESYRRANVSTRIMRTTINGMPETQKLLKECALPMAVHIHPFADKVTVINRHEIQRCRSCRTYINPFVHFTSTGTHWKCNLCQRVNELPANYDYDPIKGVVIERSKRPELHQASIEYVASTDYSVRPPQPCVHAFCIDVSAAAYESGMVNVVCDAILNDLDNLQGDERTRIAIITFDNAVHFHAMSSSSTQPREMVMSDIDDPFLPHVPEEILVSLQDSKKLVRAVLEDIPKREPTTRDNCLGSMLETVYLLMRGIGGRMAIFLSALPGVGIEPLKKQETPAAIDSKNELDAINAKTGFYKEFAMKACRSHLSTDLFIFGVAYHDIATLCELAQYGAGSLNYYPLFSSASKAESRKVAADINEYMTRAIGLEAVMRLRASNDIAIDNYHGNFFVRSEDLLSLPSVNPNNSYTLQLKIQGKQEQQFSFLQVALLYTNSAGSRRIRIHTMALPVLKDHASLFTHADQVAIVSLLAKMGVDRAKAHKTADARSAMRNFLVDACSAYRKHCVANYPRGQLLLPEQLKLLPLLVNALMQHDAFKPGNAIDIDQRLYCMAKIKTIPIRHFLDYIYPRLYSIHNMTDTIGIKDSKNRLPMPVLQQLSAESLESEGLHLICNGEAMTILVRADVKPDTVMSVFGVQDIAHLDADLDRFPMTESDVNLRIRNVVAGLQNLYPNHLRIHVVAEATTARSLFYRYLRDDRSSSALSYYEFLRAIHEDVTKRTS